MHNLIIWALIITIVAVQAYVFKMTLDKIKTYKNILPNQENFKTVKVLIKESEIETISLVSIFKNLNNYNLNREENSSEIKYDSEQVSKIEIPPKFDLNDDEYDIYDDVEQLKNESNEIQFP